MENNDLKLREQDKKKGAVLLSIKRRKRRSKRLFLLLLLLIMTGVMLTTTSYAWFTANKTVSVSDVQVNVASKNGIQISADGTNWKSIIQLADLRGVNTGTPATDTYPTAVNQIPDIANTIEPVSTGLNVDTTGKLEMFYGIVDTSENAAHLGDYIITTSTAKETEAHGTAGKYVAFDLFFKVNAVTPIFLAGSGSGVTAAGTDTGIRYASRIAFVELGNTTAGDTIANIQALNAGTSAIVYSWEPNYDVHTASGVANARDVYDVTTTLTGGTAVPYSGIIAPIAKADDILLGSATQTLYNTKFKDVDPSYKTVAGYTGFQPIFTLQNGITKMRIYMWVEGQDVDCENSASGGNIIYKLQITTEDQ